MQKTLYCIARGSGCFQSVLDSIRIFYCTFQIVTLEDKIKTLEDDNKMLRHSLSDKNAQIKLHANQINVSSSAIVALSHDLL